MNIGRLNVWIELQKSTVTTDKYANRKNAWEPFYACYATATNESPKEESAAGQIVFKAARPGPLRRKRKT